MGLLKINNINCNNLFKGEDYEDIICYNACS